uniref:Uncharacterized protein n=1 Tax=Tanacetum cinerariifolium TaxID=118510 RepID=A0A6L2J023_TANCI|nr:hypothetical protein [Tanacetum cinerariifolium]
MDLEGRTVKLDEGQARLDPGNTLKSRPPPDEDHAGSNHGQRYFMNEKQTEEEPCKANVETKVEYMITVPIHQASSSAPPLSTPIIDLTPPKPMKEILRDQMFESGSYRSKPENAALYDALEVFVDRENREEFNEAIAKSRKRCRDDQEPPPPPLKGSDQIKKKRHDSDPVDDVPIPDDVHISDSKDTGATHLPKIKTIPDWLKPVPKEERLDIRSFIKWYCKQIGKSKLSKADSEGLAFKLVKPFHKNNFSFLFQMEECHLRLIDQIDLVILKDPEYSVSSDKERRNTLSISKLKVAYYPKFRLKELVPSLWIESEREYDISVAYGISHWWFKRKEFFIIRHIAPSDRHAVRSHMKILSVVSLKTFSRYGYTFLREIVLHRADYKEYMISEANFKNLHPNDFEDLYLLHLQGNLNHLSGTDKVHLFNAVNLWIRNIVIR